MLILNIANTFKQMCLPQSNVVPLQLQSRHR